MAPLPGDESIPTARFIEDVNAPETLNLLLGHLALQNAQWDALDAKLLGMAGVSLAVAVAVIGSLSGSSSGLASWQWVGLSLCIELFVFGTTAALHAYWPCEFQSLPTPKSLLDQMENLRATRSWCDSLSTAIEANGRTAHEKAAAIKFVLLCVGLQVSVGFALAIAGLNA